METPKSSNFSSVQTLKDQPRKYYHTIEQDSKMEFLFRDAKQFTGLQHCQARSESKLNFHFNASLYFSWSSLNTIEQLKLKISLVVLEYGKFKT